jgi:hypothetical protein
MAISIAFPKGIDAVVAGGLDVVAATEEPTAVAERRLSVETAAASGVGGVVVAAAVALPLAMRLATRRSTSPGLEGQQLYELTRARLL